MGIIKTSPITDVLYAPALNAFNEALFFDYTYIILDVFRGDAKCQHFTSGLRSNCESLSVLAPGTCWRRI